MIIEYLRYRVDPAFRNEFIAVDHTVWTPLLESINGFASKEQLLPLSHEDEVIIMIWWESKELWKQVDSTLLEKTNHAFDATFGHDYSLLESKELHELE